MTNSAELPGTIAHATSATRRSLMSWATLLRNACANAGETIGQTVRLWHRRSHTRRHLADLVDSCGERDLKDLGVSPAQARYESQKRFWSR